MVQTISNANNLLEKTPKAENARNDLRGQNASG
jgi:hypothetical protein